VVQRADVDGFYGSFAEADFGTFVAARDKSLAEVLFDESLRRRMRPKFVLGGREVAHYPFHGHKGASHSRVVIESPDGAPVFDLVLAEHPERVLADGAAGAGIVIERDGRLSAVVSLIKAAYLTMFRVLGYRWALSGGGVDVGYGVLGRFFRDCRELDVASVREAATSFFAAYRHMVRPVERMMGGDPMRGSVEDQRFAVCCGIGGRPFAYVVFVRIDEMLHAVLMPSAEDADMAAEFWRFLNDDRRERLSASEAWFDADNEVWHQSANTIEFHWSIQGDTFTFS
jgi:hypothetical protein